MKETAGPEERGEPAPRIGIRDVEEEIRRWNEAWLAFPTVEETEEGPRKFWSVPDDSGVFQDDWPLGERLADETVRHMREFPEGSAVMRRILRDLDYASTVGQGFVSRLEELLTYPDRELKTRPRS